MDQLQYIQSLLDERWHSTEGKERDILDYYALQPRMFGWGRKRVLLNSQEATKELFSVQGEGGWAVSKNPAGKCVLVLGWDDLDETPYTHRAFWRYTPYEADLIKMPPSEISNHMLWLEIVTGRRDG